MLCCCSPPRRAIHTSAVPSSGGRPSPRYCSVLLGARPYPRAVPHPPRSSQSTWTSRPRQRFRPRRRSRRRPRRRRPCLRHPYHPYQPNHPTRRVIWCMRRRRGRIRSGAVAGAYGAASGGGSGSTSSSTEASHGHGRAVVGSSSSGGGQARHAPLWARHGTLSAALLLKDSLCVVHLFEVARRIGTTLSSPPTTAPKPPGAVPGATKRAVPGVATPLSMRAAPRWRAPYRAPRWRPR